MATRSLPRDSYGPCLAEVYGDIVRIRDLAWAVLMGICSGTPLYAISKYFMLSWGLTGPEKAKGYALFFGMIGCLVSGILSSRLFKAKRTLVTGHPIRFQEAILSMDASAQEEFQALKTCSPDIRQELTELGITVEPPAD